MILFWGLNFVYLYFPGWLVLQANKKKTKMAISFRNKITSISIIVSLGQNS